MPRNIEIKARVADLADLTAKVAAIADSGPIDIEQDDTFFACPSGRLKLRMFSEAAGELIFYQRADQPGPKQSTYEIVPTHAPAALRQTLQRAYGETGRVIKHRVLFLVGRTRVHLDIVHGLGQFLELEVVLDEAQPPEDGVQTAHALLAQLGIAADQLIEGAYVDLLQQTAARACS
jgi:predicted adenylyl cyclase CyaB